MPAHLLDLAQVLGFLAAAVGAAAVWTYAILRARDLAFPGVDL